MPVCGWLNAVGYTVPNYAQLSDTKIHNARLIIPVGNNLDVIYKASMSGCREHRSVSHLHGLPQSPDCNWADRLDPGGMTVREYQHHFSSDGYTDLCTTDRYATVLADEYTCGVYQSGTVHHCFPLCTRSKKCELSIKLRLRFDENCISLFYVRLVIDL